MAFPLLEIKEKWHGPTRPLFGHIWNLGCPLSYPIRTDDIWKLVFELRRKLLCKCNYDEVTVVDNLIQGNRHEEVGKGGAP